MASNPFKSSRNAVRFSRVMRLSWAIALGASVSVGLSVFTLLGTFLSLSAGRALVLPYLLLILIALPIILTLAERCGVTSGSTSPYRLAHASEYLGLTYVTGWVLMAGYIILSALLALGAATQLNILLQAFFDEPFNLSWIAIGLISLLAINNLVGTRFNWRTIAGLVFFGLLIVGAISIQRIWSGQIQSSILAFGRIRDPLKLVALMSSTLWGFYLVLKMRDQIRRPVKNIYLALLYTAGLGIFFGLLGSITLKDYSVRLGVSLQLLESAAAAITQQISPATLQILFAISGLVILLISLHFIFINALDLFDSMAQDGFLPPVMQIESKIFNTPLVPIILFTLLSILTIIFVRVDVIAGLAALTFLWTSALAQIPYLMSPGPNLPVNRHPKLPFHPLFPASVVAIGFFMPFYLERLIWWHGLIWLLFGLLFYLIYARRRGALVHRRDVTIGIIDSNDVEGGSTYRIMVGIANPNTALDLIRAGVKLARAKNGTLYVLKILQLADQVPAYLKHDLARKEWQSLEDFINKKDIDISGISVHPIVRLSHHPATGILETVSEEKIDLLLIGWSKEAVNTDINAPSIINTLIRFAKCDIAVLHGAFPPVVNRVVIPSAGGPNTQVAITLGKALTSTEANSIELIHVMTPSAQTGMTNTDATEMLQKTLNQATRNGHPGCQTRVLMANSIHEGILSAAQGCDLLVIGATQEDVLGRSYIGDMPARISQAAASTTLIVRKQAELEFQWLQRVWDIISSPLPTLSSERRANVASILRAAAVPNIDFFVLIVLSSIIASLGLLQNSAAVIIGAMLVAPLMSPILAIAMGMVLGELHVLRTAFEATIKGALLAIFVAMLMTILSPVETNTPQIMARTAPNVLDLVIALASGAAAGYAMSREELSAALPGVAIAAALVPPLAVIGYGVATSQLVIASGALLLFTTNLIAIVFAASLIFLALGFHPTRADVSGLVRGMQVTSLFLVIILVILGTTTFITTTQLNRLQEIETIFTQEVAANAAEAQNINIERDGNNYHVSATILDFEGKYLNPEEISRLETELSQLVGGTVVIDAVIISASRAESGLDSLTRKTSLTQAINEAMQSRSVEIVNLAIEEQETEIIISATLVVYPKSNFNKNDLASLSDKLSSIAGIPVSIQATILNGEYSESEGSMPETPTPTQQP